MKDQNIEGLLDMIEAGVISPKDIGIEMYKIRNNAYSKGVDDAKESLRQLMSDEIIEKIKDGAGTTSAKWFLKERLEQIAIELKTQQ